MFSKHSNLTFISISVSYIVIEYEYLVVTVQALFFWKRLNPLCPTYIIIWAESHECRLCEILKLIAVAIEFQPSWLLVIVNPFPLAGTFWRIYQATYENIIYLRRKCSWWEISYYATLFYSLVLKYSFRFSVFFIFSLDVLQAVCCKYLTFGQGLNASHFSWTYIVHLYCKKGRSWSDWV